MALTPIQREVCHLLAEDRLKRRGYLAGGAALNETLGASRLSRDLDIFHDTVEAVAVTFDIDSLHLQSCGYDVEVLRDRPGYVEAHIQKGGETLLLQWVRDSAYRFFPLQCHKDLGLCLHPFDLATNKVLALVGRSEVRDWVDCLVCHRQLSPLGLLAFAACGKDEGWNPQLILDEASRNSKMSMEEWRELEWDGPPPDLTEWSRAWKEALRSAPAYLSVLPPHLSGKAVLRKDGEPFLGTTELLNREILSSRIMFHSGHVGGAWPSPIQAP